MKNWLEASVFIVLAVALHLTAFAGQPKSGLVSGGSGGTALVSLKAAAPSAAEMVETWERSPIVQPTQTPDTLAPQPVATDAPSMPDLQIDQAPRAQMSVALAAPQAEKDIAIDPTPPPPRPKPKPEPKQQPVKKVQKAKVTSAGVAKQVSAGSGGGAHAGSGAASVSTGTPGKEAKLQAVWGAKIRARIERNKRYPRGSKAGGTATVRLSVSRDGRLTSYKLVKSTGDPALDQAALGAVSRAKKFPKAPKELKGDSFRFAVKIRLVPRK